MRRLVTKEDRNNARAAQFEILLQTGYSQETYKGLEIFTRFESERYWLKVFRGNASHPISFYTYRSKERFQLAVEEAKKSYDRLQEWRKERKENKTLSTAANAAKAIREELKTTFPGIKFSVTSENYSGGDSVNIKWEDGPTSDEVQTISRKYQQGQFNGMEDIYEYSNTCTDIPQSKYVFENRSMSEETRAVLDEHTKRICENWKDPRENVEGQIGYRVWVKTSLPLGAVVTGLEETNEGGLIENLYRITYRVPEQSASQQNYEKVETEPGELKIIDYSEKAFAVIGDTKRVKDTLKELGGKFNAKLSCGPGWIFSKKRLQAVTDRLTALSQAKENLQEEVKKTVMWLAESDKEIYGHVTEGTKEAAEVQQVKLISNV